MTGTKCACVASFSAERVIADKNERVLLRRQVSDFNPTPDFKKAGKELPSPSASGRLCETLRTRTLP